MNYSIAILFCLIAISCTAQRAVYNGKVTDRNLQPIPYAIVQVEEDKDNAIYCNANGEFAIEIDNSNTETLSFYCVGYSKRSLPVRRLNPSSILIKLYEQQFEITDTISHTAKTKQDYLGDKGISDKLGGDKKGKYSPDYGEEVAVLLEAENNGYLNEIFVYSQRATDSQIRLHVYEKAGKVPGKELTLANLIVNVTKASQWISIDISDQHIQTGTGLFISVEYLSDYKSLDTAYKIKRMPPKGHGVGLTKDYAKQGNITYKRNIFNGEWEPLNKKTDDNKKSPLNMMAYATYTYVK